MVKDLLVEVVPMGKGILLFLIYLLALTLAGCGDEAALPEEASIGPHPMLPEPRQTLFTTVNIAPVKGWSADAKPTAAPGFSVNAYAKGLKHPRWLYVLPNGDVLVAETAGPPSPRRSVRDLISRQGVRDLISRILRRKVGAGVVSPNRITLLRDADGDGNAETRSIFLTGLNSPFGMVLVANELYIANTDALLRFPYHNGRTEIGETGVKVVDLPAGAINYHWTKNVVASRDGSQLFVTVGSNSNAAEHGMNVEENRAAILQIDPATAHLRVFASGLRNPVGLAWQPQNGQLWTTVNERDKLGSDLVPDFMTSVKDGGFYGWPYSYYGPHLDTRVTPQRPDLVDKALVPDYALGAHTASLGLAFYDGQRFPERYWGGAFIGLHGSWNRRPRSGYKVIFVPFVAGRPVGMPEDILTGFVGANGDAFGRPAGVAVDRTGALLVADDVGNTIWRVTPATPISAPEQQ